MPASKKAPPDEYHGLKVGLEIHQQLDTRQKLFCRCPSELQGSRDPDFVITRYFRPVLGEMGVFDEGMLLEFEKRMTVKYEGYHDCTCTYELDETPPFPCNDEALDIALEIAALFHMNVFNELHVCRKNYLDGSVPGGFQRTMVVAQDGWYPLPSGKKIGVDILCLEEDACRRVETKNREVYFRLDRLGIPLVEITTKPDISTPEEARDAAFRIGLLLRGTGKVKKMLGATRQDVNVSIAGGERIEIKGVQKLDSIPSLIRNEISRQRGLIEVRETLADRGVTPADVQGETPVDITGAFKKTKCRFVARGIKNKQKVLGLRVPGFQGLFGKELQPDRRFGTEVSDRVSVITGLAGIIHSDEDLAKYHFSEAEIGEVRVKLNVTDDDAFVVILGPEATVRRAFVQVIARLEDAFAGVPQETRQAMEDQTTKFLRRIHGGARLYPDTDMQGILVAPDRVAAIEAELPPYPWDLKKDLAEKYKVTEEAVEALLLQGDLPLFETLAAVDPALVTLAETTLLETKTALRRDGVDVDLIPDAAVEELFGMIHAKAIGKEAIEPVLARLAEAPKTPLATIIEAAGLAGISETELEAIVARIVDQDRALVEESGMRAMGPVMGDVMKEVRGKIDGKVVSQKVRAALQAIIKNQGGKQ